jgi:N6-adenosine-specific RNA methylase IME4
VKSSTAHPTTVGDGCSLADLHGLVRQDKKFGTILADPPWPYRNKASRGAAANHYPSMTLGEIAALPVRELAADPCHLHLWVTNAFLFEVIRLIKGWGFTFEDSFAWVKPGLGMGNCWRVSHELLLLGIRGEPKEFLVHDLPSWALFPRGKHSAKPEQVRAMIERASPGPYLELFARKAASGWTVWGNEVSRDPQVWGPSEPEPRPANHSDVARAEIDGGRVEMTNAIMPIPRELLALEGACRCLAEVHDIDTIKDLRDTAQRMTHWAKRRDYETSIINLAAEAKVRTERRIGELLQAMPKKSAGRRPNKRSAPTTDSPPSLADLGISKDDSMTWQRIASIPADAFEKKIAAVKHADKHLSTATMIGLYRELNKPAEPEWARRRFDFGGELKTIEHWLLARQAKWPPLHQPTFEQLLIGRLERLEDMRLFEQAAQPRPGRESRLTLAGWTPSEIQRRECVTWGLSAVASRGEGRDEPLRVWAEVEGLLVPIDLGSDWVNPFEETDVTGVGREDTREKYAAYLAGRTDLLARLPEIPGKVLSCQCHAETCHGDHLVSLVQEVMMREDREEQRGAGPKP